MAAATLKTVLNTQHQTTQSETDRSQDDAIAAQRKFAAKLRAIRMITRPEVKTARNVVNLFGK